MISATREHEICAGHRVMGHEGRCQYVHGHNYRFVMTLTAEELDGVGRVIDFSVIKSILCQWLEDNWDHRMLLKTDDPLRYTVFVYHKQPVYTLPVNPTAENLAMYFCEDIAPGLLLGTGVRMIECIVWETSKCYATYRVKEDNVITDRSRREDVEEQKQSIAQSV